MVSVKVGLRHTVHDNRFYFSFSELFGRTVFIDESPMKGRGQQYSLGKGQKYARQSSKTKKLLKTIRPK